MLKQLTATFGLGSQEQTVASVGIDDHDALLWDEIDDHTASQYGGGRRVKFRYKTTYI